MGTQSLTYIYDDFGQLLCVLEMQYDGYLSGYGAYLAEFLHQYYIKNDKNIDMGSLAVNLISTFNGKHGYARLLSPSPNFQGEYEYHIYSNKIKVIGNKEYEVGWYENEFIELCEQEEEE